MSGPTLLDQVIVGDHSPEKKAQQPEGLPVEFRTCKESLASMFGYSVSGQPDEDQYDQMFAKLQELGYIESPEDVVVVDLRKEDHCYVNDGKSVAYPEKTHTTIPLLDVLDKKLASGMPILFKPKEKSKDPPEPLVITAVRTEEEFLSERERGAGYKNIGVTDHDLPEMADVDDFVELVSKRNITVTPPRPWIPIHCHGGKGRSSLFAAILVMVELGKRDKLNKDWTMEYIINNFLDLKSQLRLIPPPEKVAEKADKAKAAKAEKADPDNSPDMVEARMKFLKNFLSYMQDKENGFSKKINWSEWPKNQREIPHDPHIG